MHSVAPGFEYDIFISYRQNDNRSGWVTEFVNALQEELASTIKDSVSVYFDTNPHNGLLENHDVDKSLESKLKCLIFIPIISQTYCDTKSFAWQSELVAFNKLAKEDQFGRDIKLANGNVASRILPVKIHDLGAEDKMILENELGGALRAIEFIYKEAGVNRALKVTDSKQDNLNKTDYRNQVNKVANAIKEIIVSLDNHSQKIQPAENQSAIRHNKPRPNRKKLLITLLFLTLLAFAGYTWVTSGDETTITDKSIAVIPFEDLSPNQDQGYFGIGMMDEILNQLTKIGELSPVSRTSSMIYKTTTKPAKEIAEELGVGHILEGSINRSGDNIRITVKLIDAANDRSIWSESYERSVEDIMKVQTEIAQRVANSLSVSINSRDKKIESKYTYNKEAYDLYLQAHATITSEVDATPLLEKAIALDPNMSRAYSDLAFRWMLKGYWAGNMDPQLVENKMQEFIDKAIALDPENEDAFIWRFQMKLFFQWDFESSIPDLQKVAQLRPSKSDLGHFFQLAYCFKGEFQRALETSLYYFNRDRNYPGNWVGLANSYFYTGDPKKGLETLEAATKFLNTKYLSNENEVVMELGQMRIFTGDNTGAIEVFKPMMESGATYPLIYGYLGIAYARLGQKEEAIKYIKMLEAKAAQSALGSPSYFSAAINVALNEPVKAMSQLENAYENREVEMYWLAVVPIFDPLRNDPKFNQLLLKIGLKK